MVICGMAAQGASFHPSKCDSDNEDPYVSDTMENASGGRRNSSTSTTTDASNTPAMHLSSETSDTSETTWGSSNISLSSDKKRQFKRMDFDHEQRHVEQIRRAKNRLSAKQSRVRKKDQFNYMQAELMDISEENKSLKATNKALLDQVEALQVENRKLILAQQEANRALETFRSLIQSTNIGGWGRSFPPFPPPQL